jgi:uncharacterized membrane protein YphA (DoxX/SURF4 family)
MVEQRTSTATMARPAVPAPRTEKTLGAPPAPPRRTGAGVVDRAVALNARFAPTALRLALAVVFVWFGALKLAGVSPVEELLAQTLPFLDPGVSVPALGAVEVALGLALAVGRLPRLVLLVLAGHLAGTFLTFVTAAERMWGEGFLALTADGEFVVKNLVLITSALVLIAWYGRRDQERATA